MAATFIQTADRFTPLVWRVLALVNLFRLIVALLLGGLFWFITPRVIGQAQPALFIATCTTYLLFGLGAIPSLKRRWPALEIQTVVHVTADIVAINMLCYASGGLGSGLASLLILPVTAASLIVARRLGLLLAAIAAIGLLFQQILSTLAERGDQGEITQAGVLGALIFFLNLGASFAATRLRESDALIRQRDVDLANMAELNDFIVQHLRESILVVDQQDRVRLINESAAQFLKGEPVATKTLLGEVSPRLLYLLDCWRRGHPDIQTGTATLVSADGGTLIQPHFVSLEGRQPGPTLIFLEDTSVVAARVQQSKLAALGRLSASIAHEVRNPVGAMSHAAQLLREAPGLGAQDRRLTEIIEGNAERVSTIIDNILQLSRRDAAREERISLNDWLQTFGIELRHTLQLTGGELEIEPAPYEVEVGVDPSHLHQIVWNLCENALKYGRSASGRRVELRAGRIATSNRPFLEVADRGAGISNEDAEHIFEPFFTAGDGGTGLGLFIARELAHCNRAVLLYEPRHGGGSVFRIVFSDPQRWEI